MRRMFTVVQYTKEAGGCSRWGEHTMRKMLTQLYSILKREKGAVEHTMNPAYIRSSLNKKGC